MKKSNEKSIDDVMNGLQSKWKPNSGSGKTRFTRGKAKGESWIDRRRKNQESKVA